MIGWQRKIKLLIIFVSFYASFIYVLTYSIRNKNNNSINKNKPILNYIIHAPSAWKREVNINKKKKSDHHQNLGKCQSIKRKNTQKYASIIYSTYQKIFYNVIELNLNS